MWQGTNAPVKSRCCSKKNDTAFESQENVSLLKPEDETENKVDSDKDFQWKKKVRNGQQSQEINWEEQIYYECC